MQISTQPKRTSVPRRAGTGNIMQSQRNGLTNAVERGIINSGGRKMNILPNAERAFIPLEKFTKYALDPMKEPNKAIAFKNALGYTKDNAEELISNILKNISLFNAVEKGDKGFGMQYELVLNLLGANNKYANVLTGWIIDKQTSETRLTSAYVTKKKVLE